ncbi:hypothetical protein FKM82_019775 [Ascaphus truei]
MPNHEHIHLNVLTSWLRTAGLSPSGDCISKQKPEELHPNVREMVTFVTVTKNGIVYCTFTVVEHLHYTLKTLLSYSILI